MVHEYLLMTEINKALRFLRDNRGPIRPNCGAFRRVLEEVKTSSTPMATAKARLKSMLAVRDQETRQGLTALAHELIRRQGVTTATLDEIVAELRKGYQAKRLDPQHHDMIETFEAQLFTGKATAEELLDLIGALSRISAYDPHRTCWHPYRAPC
jgi:hypothetical protein